MSRFKRKSRFFLTRPGMVWTGGEWVDEQSGRKGADSRSFRTLLKLFSAALGTAAPCRLQAYYYRSGNWKLKWEGLKDMDNQSIG